jgi:hypothetical protein
MNWKLRDNLTNAEMKALEEELTHCTELSFYDYFEEKEKVELPKVELKVQTNVIKRF